MLGTNGGGFFNANSAHPYENPTALSNFLQMLAIFLIPAALCFAFGREVGDQRQGWAVLAATVWWLYRRLPHPGLKYFGLFLYGAVAVRLVPTAELLHYEPRGLVLLNWLLYSYGIPCLAFLVGAAGLLFGLLMLYYRFKSTHGLNAVTDYVFH